MNHKESLVLIILITINTLLTKKLENTLKNKVSSQEPLYDIGHAYLPDLSKYRQLNDILPLILMGIALQTRLSGSILKALIIVISMRIITAYVTVLPKSTKGVCKFDGIIGGCHDKMYSGHMSVNVLASIAIIKIFGTDVILPVLMTNILSAIMIVASRDHYTVDVILATIISILVGNKYIR